MDFCTTDRIKLHNVGDAKSKDGNDENETKGAGTVRRGWRR